MFPSSGVFSDLMCPNEHSCHRIYCPFWHPPPGESTVVETPNEPLIDSESAGYSGSFYGYNAYVGDSSASIYAPEAPIDTPQTTYNSRYTSDVVCISSNEMSSSSSDFTSSSASSSSSSIAKPVRPKKSIKDLPMPKISPVKDKTKLLNEYMSKVSELNKKIEELQNGGENKEGSIKKGESKKGGYIPTPICEIERRKKEKEKEERKKKLADEEEKKKKLKAKNKDKAESILIDALFEDMDEEPEWKRMKIEEKKTVVVQRDTPIPHLTPAQIEAAKTRIAKPSANLARQTMTPKKSISAAQQVQRRIANAAEKERQKDMDPPNNKRQLSEGEKIMYSSNGRTSASTISKGETRKAHSESNRASTCRSDKPVLRDMMDTKIPMSLRLNFLEKFFNHFSKTCNNKQSAIESAEVEEKSLKDRSSTKNGYQVAGMNTLKRLRDIAAAKDGSMSNKPLKVSHCAVLAGRHINDISIGVKRNGGGGGMISSPSQREPNLYSSLNKYILTEEQLISNGFPRWENDEKKRVKIMLHEMDRQRGKRSFVDNHDLKRTCSRCNIDFVVRKDGESISARCTYHYSRLIKKKGRSGWESLYACCDSDITVKGCTVADTHVFDTLRMSDLESFIETPPPWGDLDPRSKKVYAMDCEMVYTTWGPALARVSVVDLNDDLVLDLLVRPAHKLIDANSRFSGLQPETVESAENTLEEARLKLFDIVNSETILIGHSLESDLKAMRLVHSRVVDTSVVFPHRSGPPLKRALRTLAGEILLKIIQEDVSGHDSKEDSSACMQLMLHKLKMDGIHI